jgi:mono/diheme cytochrome c family protein
MQNIKSLIPFGLIFILSACSSFSLAGDITPPPGSNMPVVQPTQAIETGPVYPLVPPDPAIGSPIFEEKCAPCHGESGMGDGSQAEQLPRPPASLVSPEVIRPAKPVEWYNLISNGDLERFMPPFNSISERQRWDVIAHIYNMATPDNQVAEGEALYLENCASCHGNTGKADGPQAASFADQMSDFTDLKWMAETSDQDLYSATTNGVSPSMPSFNDTLSEEQRWMVVSFLRSLTFADPSKPSAPTEAPAAGSQATPETTVTPTQTSEINGAGVITGQLSFISGEKPQQPMVVTLRGFDSMQETINISTTVETDGSFSFTNVEMPVGRVFIVSTEFEGVAYGSDIAMVENDTGSINLPIPIYGSTTDPSTLSADRTHIFFEYLDPDTLRVVEIYIISNPTDRTVVAAAEGEPTIEFQLPEDAANLQFEDGVLGGRYILTADGFGDTAPIRPGSGQHQITFGYELPYDGKTEISQALNLPTNAIVILIPKDGLKIKGEQLQYTGARDVQGITYEMFTGDRIEAGEELAITVSGRPGGSSISLESVSSTNLVIGLATLGIVLIGAGVWLYRRSQQEDLEEVFIEEIDEETETFDDIPDDPEALMDAIIALDDLYQTGELPEDAYRQRRSVLKNRLSEVIEG